MYNDIKEVILETIKKIISSRLFALSIVFLLMIFILIGKLFHLQIIEGETYLNNFVQKTMRTVYTPGSRGNIYDRNGKLLAYNQLAYAVTIQDTGAYPKSTQKNEMILRLVEILNKHGEKVDGRFDIAVNADGDMIYTTNSETSRKRFLADVYGLSSLASLDDEKGKYPSNLTAKELFEKKKKDYELDKMKDEKGNPLILSDAVALQIVNIRYTLSLSSYRRYEATTIATQVKDETVADILEHIADLDGIDVAESTIRVYNDSIYFASIIGYTGKVQDDQLENLKKINENYQLNDIVGRTGIEQSMEADLQGTKGIKNISVDSVGRILEIKEDATEAAAGKDVYLTIDHDLQIATYNLLEQQLAGILVNHLVNRDVELYGTQDSSKLSIPVKDAYFQLINNNVLSLKKIADDNATDIEKQIQSKFLSSRSDILNQIRAELHSENAQFINNLPEDMASYMQYIYTYLSDASVGIIKKENIDTSSEVYLSWKAGTISLREFIYDGIANNWIDTTKLDIHSKYSNADDSFDILVDYVLNHLEDDGKFTKRIYRYLINNNVITGRELCMALYDQAVLPYDDRAYQLLKNNGENYAFTFLIDKISNIEITPAQLALDPCTAGCVVTDVHTGEVRALVTYPSYDNNRLSGTVDSAYYNQLQEDLSRPLYNNATQTAKAPGSTFKPITAVAALEEKAVALGEKVNCTGIYDIVNPPIRCWVYPGQHGMLDVVGGIENSCNVFFSEMAHRLSTDEEGNYVPSQGIATIQKYASLFGLDHTSGVEIAESNPNLTTEDPERSAMGQGTNSYTNVQLARYVTALANRGSVFELSLIDKLTRSDGTLVKDYSPEISSKIEIADSTWDAVQLGMREVVASGSAKKIFADLGIDIAGKTGTAQESKNRANHGFFISFAPYKNPEIGVTVNIPYGYTSSNAATIAKNVYSYYFGYTELEQIMNTGALDVTNVIIGD